MNHRFERLIDGMIATLRHEVIPHADGEFPRGQAYGVIYMLESIKRRADWSDAFYREQLAMQAALRDRLQPVLEGQNAPPPPEAADTGDAAALQTSFETGQDRVCALLDWLAGDGQTLAADKHKAIDTALREYMHQQVKYELKTSAKPMFAEISSGEE